MHGDHHIGTLKILYERDLALQAYFDETYINDHQEDFEIFVVCPYFMERFLMLGSKDFKYQKLIKVLHMNLLNPEPEKFYYCQNPVPGDECKIVLPVE